LVDARLLALLDAAPAMDEARVHVLVRSDEAPELLSLLPVESPVRTALDAFAEVVATRTA
jgi:heptaprenyl diphosphate synthase